MKEQIFNKELSYIENERIKSAAKYLINILPDYFFEIPASSTGKYHPEFSLGEGGLVRHTKAACLIAHDLLENEIIGGHSFSSDEKDLIILSLIIHDGVKEGIIKQKYVIFDHPLVIAKLVKENASNIELNEEELALVINMISAHMGQYNTNSYSDIILPKPNNKFERFVHMCDYLSSRKYLNIEKEYFNE